MANLGTMYCDEIKAQSGESMAVVSRMTTTDGVASGTARVIGGRASSSVADSAELPQLNSFVLFDSTYSIPANTLKSGSVLKIRAVVRITTVLNGVGATLQSRLLLGGATLITSGASTGGAVGTRCVLEAELTFRGAPGASVAASGVSTAVWSDTVAVITTAPAAAGAVPTFATNGALVVAVAAQASINGDGSGRYVCEQLNVFIT